MYPLLFTLCVVIEKNIETNKYIKEYSIAIFQILIGISVIQGNLKYETYSLYEMWIPYITFWIYFGILSFMNWRRHALLLYFTIFVFIILVNIYYDKVSIILYISIFLVGTMYWIVLAFISFKMKELIIMVKTNKDLIHTIQTILQVFPEGVIIRSLDETSKQTILKFANNIAKNEFAAVPKTEWENSGVNIKLIDIQNVSQDSETYRSISLDKFLSEQEINVVEEDVEWAEQMIKVKHPSDRLQRALVRDNESDEYKDESYFNVKTIRASWECNKESFMHVFINTTEVKRLEKEKANRKYQHMMFASLSHELRTPLNAFLNSLNLIQFTF